VADILGALEDAAAAHPEKAEEVLMGLKEQFDGLSPDQKEQALARLGEIRDQVADLPEEKRAEIEAFIREKAGV
jgi:hypothetical protein